MIKVLAPFPYLLQQRFWTIGLLSLFLLSSAMGLVAVKHLNRYFHIQLQQLREQRDQLHTEWTQLLLEQSALASDMRVEQIARDDLGMVFPEPQKTVIIKP